MDTRPDLTEDLILGNQHAGVLDQATEDFEAFRPQIEIALAGPQAPTRGIKGKTFERINARSGLVHRHLHANNARWGFSFFQTISRARVVDLSQVSERVKPGVGM